MKSTMRVFAVAAGLLPAFTGCGGEGGAMMGGLMSAATGGKMGSDSKEMQLASAGLKAAQSLTMTNDDAREIGESVAVALINQYGLISNDAINGYVTKVGLVIASVSPRSDINFTFGVLNTPEVNAFSAPGGFVLITKGALQKMQDEAELAGVLAHEVGHVCKDHGANAMKKAGMLEATAQAAGAGRGGQVAGQADFLTKNFGNAMSQGDENDADTQAVNYLKTAGYDPNGLARFLERVKSYQSAGKNFSMPTHPPTDSRLAKVRALAGTASGATLKERFAANVKAL